MAKHKKSPKGKKNKIIKKAEKILKSVNRRKFSVVKLKTKKRIIAKKKIIKKKKIVAKKKHEVKHKAKKQKKPAKKKILIEKPKKVKKNNSKKEKEIKTEFPAESLFKARIKVIGIGGGGGSIVSEIGRSLEKANFVIADTDIRALKKKSGIKYFWFGEELTHGLGTGVNVDLAKQAAESAKDKISSNFKDQDIIIFIASLGGGLGSGATQVFAETARSFGGITFGIFTMPFKFEGKTKHKIAQNALRSLQQSLNVSLVIPNEKIFKVIDANTPITDAFSMVNKSLIESLESLIDLIYNPGIINIDFADLRTILRGRGNTAFLNTIEESGKNRAEEVCKKILFNPLLQNNNFKPEKVLFNVAGSENLSMFEVEKISNHISNANPESKIIFGISKTPKLKNKIKTTILMTGGMMEEDSPAIELEPIEIIAKAPVKEQAEAVKKETEAVAEKKVETKKAKIPKIKKPTVKKKKHIEEPVPIAEIPVAPVPVLNQSRVAVLEVALATDKKTIRRSGLEIRKAEEQEEKKKMAQEKEWEIPAFLRRIKYKS